MVQSIQEVVLNSFWIDSLSLLPFMLWNAQDCVVLVVLCINGPQKISKDFGG